MIGNHKKVITVFMADGGSAIGLISLSHFFSWYIYVSICYVNRGGGKKKTAHKTQNPPKNNKPSLL